MRRNKRRILAAALLCAVLCAGCYNESGGDWDEGLPAAATEQPGPTVSYMTEETTESEEPVTFKSSESTKRTAATESVPELATTTAATSETSGDGVSTVSGVPNVPIGEFTSSTALDLAAEGSSSALTTSSQPESLYSETGSGSSASSDDTTVSAVSEPTGIEGTITSGGTAAGNLERPYSYGFLTDKQRYIYDAVISAAEKHSSTITFSSDMNVTSDDYCGVYQIIYDDEPAMFYIDTKMQYAVNSSTKKIASATVFYKYDKTETERMQAEIDTAVNDILAMITPDMTDYDKVKLFNDVLASTVEYDENAANCRDLYGVFVDKKAICGGYSKAFSYLCGKAGIETLTVTGDADGQPHMWNKVKIDGKWYNVDVTYAVANGKDGGYVRYDFFCVTDEMLQSSRSIYAQNYEYPEADDENGSYYARNGLVANSMSEAREILINQIIECSETKERVVQVKCANSEVYGEAIYYLFDSSKKQALDILDEALDDAYYKYDCSVVNYNHDSTSLVIKLFLEYV